MLNGRLPSGVAQSYVPVDQPTGNWICEMVIMGLFTRHSLVCRRASLKVLILFTRLCGVGNPQCG